MDQQDAEQEQAERDLAEYVRAWRVEVPSAAATLVVALAAVTVAWLTEPGWWVYAPALVALVGVGRVWAAQWRRHRRGADRPLTARLGYPRVRRIHQDLTAGTVRTEDRPVAAGVLIDQSWPHRNLVWLGPLLIAGQGPSVATGLLFPGPLIVVVVMALCAALAMGGLHRLAARAARLLYDP